MTSSIEYQAPQYNSNPNDSRTLDHEETILGHLLTEKQYSLKDSLYYLSSYAKEETSNWDSTETIAGGGFWVSLVAAGGAMVAMGSGPLGLTIGGVVAAIGAGGSWMLKDTAERVGKLRRTEFELHRHHPWIRDRLWEMSQKGTTAAELVAIYDRMVFTMFANGIPSEPNAIAGTMQMQTVASLGAGEVAPGHQAIEIEGARDNTTQAPANQAVTVLDDAGNAIAAAPSMSSPSVDIAQKPSFGVLKNRNPIDVLVDALFANRSIWGGQRTGKTALAAKASAEICIRESNTKIFYINLFAADFDATKEMFRHAHRSIICDLAGVKPYNAAATIEEAANVFDEFIESSGAILILDEAASMGDVNGRHFEGLSPLLDELVGYLSSIRGSTRKRKKAVWTIAPEIVAGNLGNGMRSLMKGFSPVLVAIPRGREVYWQGQRIEADTTLQGQLEINFKPLKFAVPEMDVDRACFIDGTWMPMGDCSIPDVSRITFSHSPTSTIVETTAIQSDDDGSDIPSLMEQAIVAMTVSTGESKSRIREAMLKSGDEAQSGNPAESRKILMEALSGRSAEVTSSTKNKAKKMQFTKAKEPEYKKTEVSTGIDCVVVYSGEKHPEDSQIRSALIEAGYQITFEHGHPYSKYIVTWTGLSVHRHQILSEIQNAYYGEGWDN